MGTALTAAISAINAESMGDDSARLIAAKCRGLLAGYFARWGSETYWVSGVEQTVHADLYNPATHARSRSFRMAGKLDLSGLYGDRAVIVDHKTTSEDISDPSAPYWRQLGIEAQASHYMLLEWLNGRKVDSAVWDVIRKPSISPKSLAKKDVQDVTMFKRYSGLTVSDESIAEMQSTGRETIEMYEARLANDCISERPNWYFQRRTVPRLDAEILEYASELWDHSQEIILARRLNRWPRNSGACMLYGSPCKFLGICSGHDTAESDNWKQKAQVHKELPIDGDGRDVLTVSRVKSFQTCRRKHFYEYELGIERRDEEERESLFFGTLLHKGLEAFFQASMSSQTAPAALVQIKQGATQWQQV